MFLPPHMQTRCGRCEPCGVESSEADCWVCGLPMEQTMPSTVINPHRWNPNGPTPIQQDEDWESTDWGFLHLIGQSW